MERIIQPLFYYYGSPAPHLKIGSVYGWLHFFFLYETAHEPTAQKLRPTRIRDGKMKNNFNKIVVLCIFSLFAFCSCSKNQIVGEWECISWGREGGTCGSHSSWHEDDAEKYIICFDADGTYTCENLDKKGKWKIKDGNRLYLSRGYDEDDQIHFKIIRISNDKIKLVCTDECFSVKLKRMD